MEKVEAAKSRWAMFISPKIIRRLTEVTVGEWHNNGLEFMTFTEREDHSFQYYVKASKALRKSKWTNFINLVGGHSLAVFRANKYKNPIDELRGTPREHEARSNTFTVDKNPPVSPQNSERSSGRKKIKKCAVSDIFRKDLDDFMTQPGVLWHVASKTFGADWDTEECKALQAFSQLEAHRRVLKLEAFLAGRKLTLEQHAALRADAFGPSKYIVIDPLTLCLPFFLSFLGGATSIRDNALYRLRAVAACILPMLRYGEALTAMVPTDDAGSAEAWAFRPPFPFLPPSLQRVVAGGVDDSVARRVENEKRELADALDAGKVPRESALVGLHARMLARAAQTLALDTHENKGTRALPPTPSFPDAVYELAAFLG